MVILMNDNANIIELIDEEGDSVFFEHLMTLTYRGQDYVILAILEDEGYEDEEELEIVILRVEVDEDGNDSYVGIEDKDELDEVLMVYDEVLNSDVYQ